MHKRLFSLLMGAVMLFSCAFAAPETPYPAETMIVYHQQPAAVQKVIDLLYAGAMNCETEIPMPPGTLYDTVDQAWIVLQNEFPELLHLGNQARIVYFQNAPSIAISARLEYTMTAEEYAAIYGELLQTAQEIAGMVSGTDYERELQLHDAVAARASYSQNVNAPNVHDAYGALVNGDSVCEGYAQALTLLCRLSDIPCSMLIGQAGTNGTTTMHGWNVVEIEGELLLTDCTYNDHNDDTTVHWYFNLPAQDMAATHHTDTVLPLSESDQWTYAHQTGGYIADESEMQAVFDAQFARMQATGVPAELRAADAALYQLLLNSLDALIEGKTDTLSYYAYDRLYMLTLVPQ